MGRIDCFAIGSRASTKGIIALDHLHVAVDDASRRAYVELLPSLCRQDVTGFFTGLWTGMFAWEPGSSSR